MIRLMCDGISADHVDAYLMLSVSVKEF